MGDLSVWEIVHPGSRRLRRRHAQRGRGRWLADLLPRADHRRVPATNSLVSKATQQMVEATIRTVFPQPDAASARHQWRRVADGFRARFPKLAELMDEAEADVLAYASLPAEHW